MPSNSHNGLTEDDYQCLTFPATRQCIVRVMEGTVFKGEKGLLQFQTQQLIWLFAVGRLKRLHGLSRVSNWA